MSGYLMATGTMARFFPQVRKVDFNGHRNDKKVSLATCRKVEILMAM